MLTDFNLVPEEMKACALSVPVGIEELVGPEIVDTAETSEIDKGPSMPAENTTKKGKRKRGSKKKDSAEAEVGGEAQLTKCKKSAKRTGKEKTAHDKEQDLSPSEVIVEKVDGVPPINPASPVRLPLLPNINPTLQQDVEDFLPLPSSPVAKSGTLADEEMLENGPNVGAPEEKKEEEEQDNDEPRLPWQWQHQLRMRLGKLM